HPCRLGVDDQLNLGRLGHRQLGSLIALQDAPSRDADLTIAVRQASAVAHQAAGLCLQAILEADRNPVARRQQDQLDAAVDQERTTAYEQRVGSLAREACKRRVDFATGAGGAKLDL